MTTRLNLDALAASLAGLDFPPGTRAYARRYRLARETLRQAWLAGAAAALNLGAGGSVSLEDVARRIGASPADLAIATRGGRA